MKRSIVTVITEDTMVPGTDVVLEEGDRVKVVLDEALVKVSPRVISSLRTALQEVNAVVGDYEVPSNEKRKWGFSFAAMLSGVLDGDIIEGVREGL